MKVGTIALLIFVSVFCALAIPFSDWGFKTDDWGNVYHATTKDWSTLHEFFTEGSSENVFNPCNATPTKEAFFQGLYRPMSFIYYFIQYKIFGTTPCGYFVVSILMHALNSALLFLILSTFFSTSYALFASLLFAFHPSLASWIGWTSAQTYFIELFILMLILVFLFMFLTRNKFLWYLIACLLYLANMFLKEQTIFLPLWLLPALYIYHTTKRPWLSTQKRFLLSIWQSLGFWAVWIFYIITRLQFFPLTKETGTLTFEPTLQSFINRMSSRFFDFVSYVNDILGLCWLPTNSRMLKSIIFIALFLVAFVLLIKTKNKFFAACAFASMLLWSWPALLMHYQPRYLYMSVPWLLIMILLLLPTDNTKPNKKLIHSRLIRQSPICLLICVNIIFMYNRLGARQNTLLTITRAFKQLAQNPTIKNRNICFIDLPCLWFDQGSAQAMWMLTGQEKTIICQFGTLATIPEEYTENNPIFITWDCQLLSTKVESL